MSEIAETAPAAVEPHMTSSRSTRFSQCDEAVPSPPPFSRGTPSMQGADTAPADAAPPPLSVSAAAEEEEEVGQRRAGLSGAACSGVSAQP